MVPAQLLLVAACVAAALSAAGAHRINATEPLEGVDAAQAIVTWPLKADDSPVGIVMAGATLGNRDVLSRAMGDDGALEMWKGKSKAAAKAAVDEVVDEVMQDDPHDALLGQQSSTYKELQAVLAKAKALTIKVPSIGDGGAASATASSKGEAQAEAAAIMASSEAAVTEAYDMPPPPEAAEDAPFARKALLNKQKRALSGRQTPTRIVNSDGEGVVGSFKRALSAPLARLMSLLDEDESPPCGLGTSGPDGGPCEICPKNTYKDVEGSDECSACPDGTRTAKEGRTSLEDCWDGPMDLESPMGMVMAGPNLADPDVLNKSVTSGAIELWKGKVSGAAKKAVEEVQEEVMDDDLLGVKGAGSQTARELSDVVARARSLTKKMGKVELGGEWAWSAKKKAEAQADAVAFMAAHEAVVADSYVDDDDRGLLNRKSEILYPFGHHNMHKEHGENIGYPGGNRPYYARDNQNEHVGQYLNANVGGPTHAYYESARRAGGEVIRPAAMQARLQSLDALWEGIPPDSDGTDEASKSVWIGAVSGQSPMKAQMMEHNLEHQFLSSSNGPIALGAVATGSSSGAAGAAFTGVADSNVWHTSWISSSDSSIAAPSETFAKPSASTSYSKASKAGDRIAQQEAAALTPPGSGMRGPPEVHAQASSASGCSTEQIGLCHAGCDSKLNLEMQAVDPEYTSKHKWNKSCMSKCLGPCAKELGFEAKAAEKIVNAMTNEEDLIKKMTKEFDGKGSAPSSHAATVASDAIKRLEQRAGLTSGSSASGAGSSGTSSVWHFTPGRTPAPSPGVSGVQPFPAKKAKTGAQTGVYDCTGQALTVGAVVARMVPGRACEDQYLVVSAGMWKVTDYKQPGAAEKVEMRHGANVKGRVGVVLHGISPGVNKGTRVELVPFVGSFTHWKLVRGGTKDLFLPANVAAITGRGHHNKAGVADPSGFTSAFHTKKSAATVIDKTGESQSESVFSMQAQRQNADWGQTSITEKQDANLAMCPGPSCPSDGPSKTHRIMHLGNPFWKYIIVAIVVSVVLAFQYLKRLNDGAIPGAAQEYVQLPNLFGGGGGAAGGRKEGVELESKGGARPCQGMKSSDRIVQVENASDRIIMVDVGGGGGSAQTSRAGAGNGDTASQDVGYQ